MTAIQKILVLFSATTILFSCNTKKSDTATLQQFNISQQKVWKENATVGSWQYNSGRLGFWGTDSSSLPVFHYTGKLPARTFRPDGREVNDKQDPIFLLGNYHLTLFAYASGKYQLMTLERSIASLNHDSINLGRGSFATLVLPDDTSKNKTHELLGLGSAAATDSNTEKAFGCGYAVYKYNLKGLKIRRTLATIPSQNIYDGCSAFLVNVEIENASDKDVTFSYAEGLTTSYEFMFRYNYPGLQIRASYPVTTRIDIAQNLAVADFNVKEKAAYAIGGRFDHTSAESYPQQVRLQLFPANDLNYQVVAVNKDSMRAELSGKVTGSIRKGAGTKFCYVIGYDNYANDNYWAASAQRLLKGVHQELPFRDEWKKEIGDFSYEKNDTIRNEMLWNQHALLAMANWNEWYQDMFIPQGNIYEYGLGVAATTSDFLMHTLPLSHTKPELSKSVIRGVLKQTNFRGEINPSNEGACRIPTTPWRKSHTNIYMCMAIAEYLQVNNDAAFLNEKIPFWGYPYCGEGTVLDRIERVFVFLRDEIYHGKHGLVRLMLSDWNDCFYFYFDKENFFSMFRDGESVSNTTMAVLYVGDLCDALDSLKNDPSLANEKDRILYLINGMREYRKEQLSALLNVWSDRPFLIRAYLGSGKALGKDTMYLESQTYAIGIKDIPMEKRKALWNEIRKRVWDSEKMGARQGEVPFVNAGRGSAENGGFWYSLNGPLIVGLDDIDPKAANDAFRRITMINHAQQFPDYWVGMWSGPDTYDSSISPGDEGLVRRWGSTFPVYCAHAHAWPLWCYMRLKK